MFILQPEAFLSKNVKIIPLYSLLGDKWSAYDRIGGNPLSGSDVQPGDRRAREGRGEGRELDGEGQQRANCEFLWHLIHFTVHFKYSLLGQFFSCAGFSL